MATECDEDSQLSPESQSYPFLSFSGEWEKCSNHHSEMLVALLAVTRFMQYIEKDRFSPNL